MEWPVSLVLNHKALAQYQMLFRYSHAKVSNTKSRIFSSVVDPDSMESLDSYPDSYPNSQSGSGSRRAKMAHPDSLEMLDPNSYPDLDSINPDPQH